MTFCCSISPLADRRKNFARVSEFCVVIGDGIPRWVKATLPICRTRSSRALDKVLANSTNCEPLWHIAIRVTIACPVKLSCSKFELFRAMAASVESSTSAIANNALLGNFSSLNNISAFCSPVTPGYQSPRNKTAITVNKIATTVRAFRINLHTRCLMAQGLRVLAYELN